MTRPTKGRMGRRGRGQGGAATIEFAIVSLVLFMLFFAVIDMGLIEVGNSASGNAAREGARIASLYPVGADTTGTPSNNAVITAVTTKMGGLIKNITVLVTCLGPTGTPVISCTAARADTDLVRVAVTFRHRGVSPFVTTSTKTESATMLVMGSTSYVPLPSGPPTTVSATTTTTAAGRCNISAAGADPAAATIAGASEPGPLTGPVTVSATTVGSCGYLYAVVFYPGATDADPYKSRTLVMTKSGDTFSHTIDPLEITDWRTGEATVLFFDSVGQVPGVAAVLRLSSSSVCSVLSANVNPPTTSPPAAQLASTTEPAALAAGTTVQVNMTATAACGPVYAAFTPGVEATTNSVLMAKSGTAYTLTIGAGTYSTWTKGLKVFSFTDGASTPTAYQGPTASVQVNAPPPACNVSVTFTTLSGSVIGQVDVRNHGGDAELNQPFIVSVSPTGTCSLPIYAQWDRGKGFAGPYGQAALTSNSYTLPADEGGNKAWAQEGGTVTFRFFNGVPTTSNQLTPLTPVTLRLV